MTAKYDNPRMPLGMPKVEILPLGGKSRRRFKLLEEWHYIIPGKTPANDIHIVVPKGFIFDGASIPRIFTAIYNPVGYLLVAAIIHDYCYQYGYYLELLQGRTTTYQMAIDVNRLHADIMFKRIGNLEYPEDRGKTKVAFNALRMGGWVTWNKHRKK